jgi:hypothetical protein
VDDPIRFAAGTPFGLIGPWGFPAHVPNFPSGTGIAPAPPTPVGPGRGKALPCVRRAPLSRLAQVLSDSGENDAASEVRRLASHTDETSNILNSLIRQGYVIQRAAAGWILNPAGGTSPSGGLTGQYRDTFGTHS